MARIWVLCYAVVAYLAFFVSFTYLMGFVAGIGVPKTVNSGTAGDLTTALLVNVLLVTLFGLQHAVMARDWFKERLTRYLPEPMERSTFVLAASLVLGLIMWQWRPILEVAWAVELPWLRVVLWCGFVAGLVLVFYSSFLIDHFDLFGLRQAWLYYQGKPYEPISFATRSLYEYVRHPMMVGIALTMWSVPLMSWGHLLLATLMSLYILVGTHMEERGLMRKLGHDYCRYREVTPMLIPFVKGRFRPASTYLCEESSAKGH